MTPEEVPELLLEHGGLAFLPPNAAWRIARDGITTRLWLKIVYGWLRILRCVRIVGLG